MAGYLLKQQVFLRPFENGAIVLDLRRDAYLALDAAEAAALSAVLQGWPAPAPGPGSAPARDTEIVTAPRDESTVALQSLLAQGVLTQDPRAGKTAVLIEVEVATAALGGIHPAPRISIVHVLRFFRACFTAALLLKCRPIASVIQRVQHRKQNALRRAADTGWCVAAHDAEAQELIQIFHRLRPFAYTASRACLLNSLTLIEYLARYRRYPDWIFGVRIAPFAAHCWVQSGAMVLNGSVQYTADFAPIMAV